MLKKSWILFGLLLFSTLISGLFFRGSFGTLFFMLLTGIVGAYLAVKGLHKKYPNRWTKALTWAYRIGLILIGLASIIILTLVSLPQFSCQNIDQQKVTNADYMIVLGAGLERGDQLSYNLKSRLDKTLDVLKINPDLTVIVSGGQGDDETIPEAHVMKAYLMEHGVSEHQIVMEDQSRSTYQNLVFSKKFLEQSTKIQDSKGIIITQEFHIFRSRFIAHKLGLETFGICSRSARKLRLSYMIREIPAVMNDALGNVLK